MAVNNIYITDQPVYRVYVKTVPSIVSGIRLADGSRQAVSFVLTTTDDPTTSRLFVYSKLEDDFVRRENRSLFSNNILIPELPAHVIDDLLSKKTIADFKKALSNLSQEELRSLLLSDRLTQNQRKEVESRLSIS